MGDSRKINKKGRYPSRDFNGPLVSCVHIKTSTVTETVYKQPVVMMSIVKQLLRPKHLVIGKSVKL